MTQIKVRAVVTLTLESETLTDPNEILQQFEQQSDYTFIGTEDVDVAQSEFIELNFI